MLFGFLLIRRLGAGIGAYILAYYLALSFSPTMVRGDAIATGAAIFIFFLPVPRPRSRRRYWMANRRFGPSAQGPQGDARGTP